MDGMQYSVEWKGERIQILVFFKICVAESIGFESEFITTIWIAHANGARRPREFLF